MRTPLDQNNAFLSILKICNKFKLIGPITLMRGMDGIERIALFVKDSILT